MTADLILRRASLAPGQEADLTIRGGRLVDGPAAPDAEVVDLAGRPVVPGLADHHIHLLALAAAWASVDCSPLALASGGGFAQVLRRARSASPIGWLRCTGYDVAASGPIDADRLDALGVGPIRVQDRTGIRWVLDRRGLAEVLPADPRDWPAGAEVDDEGRPTGVLVRLDAWLRDRLPPHVPSVSDVGRWLSARGVTSVTDAGADNGADELALLAGAGLPQRLTVMTRDPDVAAIDGAALGPVKILLDDDDLPPLDVLAARIDAAHRLGRPVAVHCVTEVQLVLALTAGVGRRDRIEHASMVPDAVLPLLVAADPTVVVQPGFVFGRGDRYLAQIDPADLGAAHRLGALVDAGLHVAASSDAPYGPPDPWIAITAASRRRTRSGAELGPAEAITPSRAVQLYSGSAGQPGVPRSPRSSEVADLVVIDDDWDRLDGGPAIAATLIAGRLVSGSLDV